MLKKKYSVARLNLIALRSQVGDLLFLALPLLNVVAAGEQHALEIQVADALDLQVAARGRVDLDELILLLHRAALTLAALECKIIV